MPEMIWSMEAGQETLLVDVFDDGALVVDDEQVALFAGVPVPNGVFAVEELVPSDQHEARIQNVFDLEILFFFGADEVLEIEEVFDILRASWQN